MSEREPEELRRDIEQTRAELGATVEALSHKADVKARLSDKAGERRDQLRDKLRETTPQSAQESAGQAVLRARERPLPVAAGGAFAAGLLMGWILRGRRA